MKLSERLSAFFGRAKATPAYGPLNWPSAMNFQTSDVYANRCSDELTSTVFSIISGISQDIGTLPLRVGVQQPDGVFKVMPDSNVQAVLSVPNNYQTGVDMMSSLVIGLLSGNAYAYTPRNRYGDVVEIHPLDTSMVTPVVYEGVVYYRVRSSQSSATGEIDALIPKREMLHIPYLLLGSQVLGIGPMRGAAMSAAQQRAISQNSAAFFENSAQPSGILSTDQKIEKVLAERLKAEWTEKYSNGRFGQISVLGSGLTWTPMMMTSADAQLIEQMKFTTVDISRAFRYPLVKLNALDNATYRNTEAQQRDYYVSCLRPLIEKIEAALDRHWGFPYLSQPRAFEFDMMAFMRSESDVRATTYASALDKGWMSINEVRRLEGLPPVDGGEMPRLQAQYIPINEKPEPAPDPAPAPADPAELPEGDPEPEDDSKALFDAIMKAIEVTP